MCITGKTRQLFFALQAPRHKRYTPSPPLLSARISYEIQTGAVAVTDRSVDLLRYLIVWPSNGVLRRAKLALPRPGSIATYVYQGNIVVAAPEDTKITDATGEIIITHQKVNCWTHTLVFPNGLAANWGVVSSVIDLNNWKVLFSPVIGKAAHYYWQAGNVYASLTGKCYQVSTGGPRLVVEIPNSPEVFPAILEINGVQKEMFVRAGLAVIGEEVILLPTYASPEYFVAEEGIYFNCFEGSSPQEKVVSFYSFSEHTVTDIVVSAAWSKIETFPPRKGWEWSCVVQNPEAIEEPEGLEELPGFLGEKMLFWYRQMPAVVPNLAKTISTRYRPSV